MKEGCEFGPCQHISFKYLFEKCSHLKDINHYAASVWFGQYKMMQKNLKPWHYGYSLIWEYSMRAI